MLSATGLASLVAPAVTNFVPVGYTPAQIRDAYGFNQVSFGSVQGNGAGQTIGIVDAFHDPHIVSDVQAFSAAFGLPQFNQGPNAPTFNIVNQTGGGDYAATNAGWALEIALDVEWAHAVAPGANILLVEAANATMDNLLSAVDYAAAHAQVVSMSWSGNEFAGETGADSHFAVNGVTFVASAGDSGGTAMWPSASPNVVSVGGTRLRLTSNGTYISENGWVNGGGGVSAYESQPGYQNGVVSQSTIFRTMPDVAYDASPLTGVAVYDSVPFEGQSGWVAVGGTSAGAPQWAGLVAIADQGRALLATPLGPLDGASQTLPTLYGLYAAPGMAGYSTYTSYFHDVTTGNNGSAAGAGYDTVTGLGTPHAAQVVSALVHAGTPVLSTSGIAGPGKAAKGGGKSGGGQVTPALVPGVTTSVAAQVLAFMADVQAASATTMAPAPVFTLPPVVSGVRSTAFAVPVQPARPATTDLLPQLAAAADDALPIAGPFRDGDGRFGAPKIMPKITDQPDSSTATPPAAATPAAPVGESDISDEDWSGWFEESSAESAVGPTLPDDAGPGQAVAVRLALDPTALSALAAALVGGYLRARAPEDRVRRRLRLAK
jgi:hypothetical protein